VYRICSPECPSSCAINNYDPNTAFHKLICLIMTNVCWKRKKIHAVLISPVQYSPFVIIQNKSSKYSIYFNCLLSITTNSVDGNLQFFKIILTFHIQFWHQSISISLSTMQRSTTSLSAKSAIYSACFTAWFSYFPVPKIETKYIVQYRGVENDYRLFVHTEYQQWKGLSAQKKNL
jgi:hypothetical protein